MNDLPVRGVAEVNDHRDHRMVNSRWVRDHGMLLANLALFAVFFVGRRF